MNRKGQEEMIGFVLIVVLVAVIFLVLLGMFLYGDNSEGEEGSREIIYFLESLNEYTSSCAINYEPNYAKIGELYDICYSGRGDCLGGKESCDALKEEVEQVISQSFNVNNASFYKGLEFLAYVDKEEKEQILLINKGNCSNAYRGGDILKPIYAGGGNIIVELKLCFD